MALGWRVHFERYFALGLRYWADPEKSEEEAARKKEKGQGEKKEEEKKEEKKTTKGALR